MNKNSDRLLAAFSEIDEKLIEQSAPKLRTKTKNPNLLKWISVAACFVLIAGIAGGIWLTREPKIEYNYSMIKTHSSSNTGYQMPYDVKNLAEFSQGFIEFVVLSEPKEITYEYVDQKSIDDAIAQNYSEEDMEIIYREAMHNHTVPCVPIRIENVFYEKEGCELAQYDEIWLYGTAGAHQESFVQGARFAAYVEIMAMDDPNISKDVPVDLYINSYIYYIDENDNLIPFTDDPSLMQYEGYSVEEMADLVFGAAEKIKERESENNW